VKPAALDTFDNIREESLVAMRSAKQDGTKVVGIYCTYCPRELVLAGGGIPVGLCGTRETPIAAAEQDLPRNLCPLIKSSYGFAITDTCPFFATSDLVIGETTCDGKKKMFEIMQSKQIKEIYVMQLPQAPDEEASVQLWYSELKRLKAYLERFFGRTITDEALRQAIHQVNEESLALQALFDLNQARPALISGMDMLRVAWQIGFQADRQEAVRLIDNLAAETRAKASEGLAAAPAAAPRILLTGTPVGVGSEKVIELVESSGGLVVAMENCGGYKTVELRVDEQDQSDPLLLLARKYMQIPCSVMSPNRRRFDLLQRMIRDFQVDGVIDLTWQACHTYNIESHFVADLVKNQLGLPFLQLETDYSQSDIETLRVRIQAFLEMV